MGGRGASSGVKDRNSASSIDTARGTSQTATLEILDTVIRGASEESMKRLAEMAKSGELPSKIEGSRDERAKIYEEIDRLYPDPPGVMNVYHVNDYGGSLDIHMDYGLLVGEDPRMVSLPRGRKASDGERSGAVKYAIYKHRGPLELAATCRAGGYPTYEMRNKWGGRLLTKAEKTQADREIEAHVEDLFKSPMSREGRKYNTLEWKEVSGGWCRAGDDSAPYTNGIREGIRREIEKERK